MKKLSIVVAILLILAICLCACSAEDIARNIADKVVPEDKKPQPKPDEEQQQEEGQQQEGGEQEGSEDGDEDGEGDEEGGTEYTPKDIVDETDYGPQNKSLTEEQFYAAFDYVTNFKNCTITVINTLQSPGVENNVVRDSSLYKYVINETALMQYRQDDEGNLLPVEYICIKNGQLLRYEYVNDFETNGYMWKEEYEPEETEEVDLRDWIPTTVGSLIYGAKDPTSEDCYYKYEDFRYNEGSDLYTTNKSETAFTQINVMMQLSIKGGKLVYINELNVGIWGTTTDLMYSQDEYSIDYTSQVIDVPAELAALIP